MARAAAAADARTRVRVTPPLPPLTLAGFVVAIVAVVLIAVFSYRSLQSRAASADLVSHTIEVMQQLQTVLSGVKDAETGQRGFLLTGTESYLAPYAAAKTALPGQLDHVAQLTADSAEQGQRLGTLRRLIDEKFEEWDQTVAMRRAGDADGALAVVRSNRGQLAMNRIRALVGEMDEHERG